MGASITLPSLISAGRSEAALRFFADFLQQLVKFRRTYELCHEAAFVQSREADRRAEFSAKRNRVLLNGKAYIEMDDDPVSGAGAVGLWTKVDGVTLFDDFSYGVFAGR